MHIEKTRRVNANPNGTAGVKTSSKISIKKRNLRLHWRCAARVEPAASEMVRLAAVKWIMHFWTVRKAVTFLSGGWHTHLCTKTLLTTMLNANFPIKTLVERNLIYTLEGSWPGLRSKLQRCLALCSSRATDEYYFSRICKSDPDNTLMNASRHPQELKNSL